MLLNILQSRTVLNNHLAPNVNRPRLKSPERVHRFKSGCRMFYSSNSTISSSFIRQNSSTKKSLPSTTACSWYKDRVRIRAWLSFNSFQNKPVSLYSPKVTNEGSVWFSISLWIHGLKHPLNYSYWCSNHPVFGQQRPLQVSSSLSDTFPIVLAAWLSATDRTVPFSRKGCFQTTVWLCSSLRPLPIFPNTTKLSF